jgi:hypothetical protein
MWIKFTRGVLGALVIWIVNTYKSGHWTMRRLEDLFMRLHYQAIRKLKRHPSSSLCFSDTLSLSFLKISKLFPAIRELTLIRGKSLDPKGQIERDSIEGLEIHFEWQYGTLIQAYQREILTRNKTLSTLQRRSLNLLQHARRATRKGVGEFAISERKLTSSVTCCY